MTILLEKQATQSINLRKNDADPFGIIATRFRQNQVSRSQFTNRKKIDTEQCRSSGRDACNQTWPPMREPHEWKNGSVGRADKFQSGSSVKKLVFIRLDCLNISVRSGAFQCKHANAGQCNTDRRRASPIHYTAAPVGHADLHQSTWCAYADAAHAARRRYASCL